MILYGMTMYEMNELYETVIHSYQYDEYKQYEKD